MLAGHIGVALAVGSAERRVNVGVFIAAALLLDFILWLLVLLGIESVSIPPDFATTRQPAFVFPYSHGLLAAAVWSVVAGAIGFWSYARQHQQWRIGVLIVATVFSHWLLDALVHQPELPLAGSGSIQVGLGLWDTMPIAVGVEAAIVVLGVSLFVAGSRLSRGRSVAVAVLSLGVLALTVFGMTVAPPAPSAFAMALSSLLTLVAVTALAVWLGRLPRTVLG
jgi:hypothetical protein